MQNEVSKAAVSKSGKVRKNYIPATLHRTSLLITLSGTNFKVNSPRLGKFSVRAIVLPHSIPTCHGSSLSLLEREEGLSWAVGSFSSGTGCGVGLETAHSGLRVVVALAVLLDLCPLGNSND